jgi:DNA-binding XRE family transcriptional regulator
MNTRSAKKALNVQFVALDLQPRGSPLRGQRGRCLGERVVAHIVIRLHDERAFRDMQGFGELLRRYRLDAGLTQQELADRAGLSVRAVSDLERGVHRTPYPDTLRRLTQALGVTDEAAAAFRSLRSQIAQASRPPPASSDAV